MSPRTSAVLALLLLISGCSGDRDADSSGVGLSTALAPEMSQQQLERLARDVLAESYGDSARDEALDCWRDEAAEKVSYCMRLEKVGRVEEAGQAVLYVLASNVNRFNVPDYQYEHADSGRAAAFAVTISPDGSLGDLIASGSGLSFGSNGSCGCEDARLVRLGAETHAWHFVSGGVWQGIVVANHVLLARTDDGFVDVSEIPEVSEDDQLHRISIAVDESDPSRKQFPIIVTRRAVVDVVAANPPNDEEEVVRWVVSPSEIDGLYRFHWGVVAG